MNEIFLKISNMNLSASWLILAVLVIRFALKKAPKWFHVLLWGIVAIRLICPFTIESSFSLIPDSIGSGELISRWTDDYMDDIDIHHPDSIYYDAVIGAGREPIYDGEGGYYVVTKHDQLEEPATVENTIIPVLSVIWIIGMTVLILYTTVSYWCLYRKLGTAVHYKDNIYQNENVNSPFVFGIIKPRIYLPFKIDAQALEYVIAHEQAHICRKDHWWKPLGFLLLTVHWFNPLMWLAYILLGRDIELACDEKVIKKLDSEQKADYTQALVACSINCHMSTACPLAFGEIGVKERVKSVMNYKKPAFGIVILAVISCAVISICFLTNPKQDTFMLRIVVPAGSREPFVYTDEEISTISDTIKIWSCEGLGDAEVLLSPVDKTTETGYVATYLTRGMPVVFDAEKDTWFKVGVNVQNPTEEDIIVYVEVENVEVRISEEVSEENTSDTDIVEVFRNSIKDNFPDKKRIVVTDYVYADDKAYGLDGVVQYEEETSEPWKLAFIHDDASYPVSVDLGTDYRITSKLTYLGNGIVQVYVEDTKEGAVYQYLMEYTYDSEEKQTNFKATSNKVADRSLTQEEIDQINETFSPILFDKQGNPIGTNIWNCFFTSYYSDVQDMNFAEFMTYFPKDGTTVDEAEFSVLKEQKDFLFYGEVYNLADMPVPVHKYPVRIINLMLKEYAGITVEDLDTSDVNYLSEYDAFYNYTSDMGYGTFTCTRGEIDGDIVRLYEESDGGTDMLTLRKEGNSYHIVSHLQLK